jgi:hypothetical protein
MGILNLKSECRILRFYKVPEREEKQQERKTGLNEKACVLVSG